MRQRLPTKTVIARAKGPKQSRTISSRLQVFLDCFATLAMTLFFSFSLFFSSPTFAREERLSFIRDAEIEYYLHALGAPVFRAAAIDPNAVNLLIIQDSAINAFVAGGMNIFFYTGLLQSSESPDELLGVIAHETGHIAGGHLVRGSEAMRGASTQAIIGMLAGLAIGVASGRGDVAIGAIGGSQEIAMRNLMSFSRAQESSADSAALSFLDSTGQSSSGLLSFMKKLSTQELLPADRQSQYVRTHPLSQDRVENLSHHVEKSPYSEKKIDPKFVTMHERMKAKLLGFLQPASALLRYTDKDPRLPARYARAIALYRSSQLQRALPIIDGLLKEEPNNPFFLELKAQMLFENGRIKEAVDNYKRSVELAPDSSLLKVAYAHALLELKDDSRIDLAIQNLLDANRLEAREPQTWRFLASAWSRKREATKDDKYQGLVSYALAEEALAKGQEKQAKENADRALKSLPKGSPYWLRAQDIKLSAETDPKD